MQLISKSARTNLNKRPDYPLPVIRSPFDLACFMSNITIIGDAHFIKFGSLIVRLGGQELLNVAAGDAALAQRITIPVNNTRWSPSDQLEFYFWTSQGYAEITVFVGADLEAIDPAAVAYPMDEEALNRLVATEVEGQGNTAAEWLRELGRAVSAYDTIPDVAADVLAAGFNLNNRAEIATKLKAAQGLGAVADSLLLLAETLPIPNYNGDALFPNKFYFNETHTRLIDMRGNKNLLMVLSAPQTPEPAPLTPPATHAEGSYTVAEPDGTPLAEIQPRDVSIDMAPIIYDLILPTGRSANVSFSPYMAHATYPPPNLGTPGRLFHPLVERTLAVDVADNPSMRNATTLRARSAYTRPFRLGSGFYDPTFTFTNVNERYLRITLGLQYDYTVRSTGNTPRDPYQAVRWTLDYSVNNFQDSNITGGSAALSFEVPNGVGDWQEFIPPVAIARGAPVSRQFGAANSSYILPSGPRALRARLAVTGALETSAVISLVS